MNKITTWKTSFSDPKCCVINFRKNNNHTEYLPIRGKQNDSYLKEDA